MAGINHFTEEWLCDTHGNLIRTLIGATPPMQGKSLPVQVKGPYSSLHMITCRLSSRKEGVYNVHLLIILERGCSSMDKKKERAHSRGWANINKICTNLLNFISDPCISCAKLTVCKICAIHLGVWWNGKGH